MLWIAGFIGMVVDVANEDRMKSEGSTMTRLLEQAISQIQKLPTSEQDAIASLILEELADEQRWQEAFASSQDQLAAMAEKVRKDIREGRVKNAGLDEL
jgi:hypothetical protein